MSTAGSQSLVNSVSYLILRGFNIKECGVLLKLAGIVLSFINTDPCYLKVKILWEGPEIWKKSPTCFDFYSVTAKQVGDFCKL